MSNFSSGPPALDRQLLVVAAVLLVGSMMSILDMTAVNVALETLALEFDSSFATIQWVITGYTLALAAVIPLSGWAADRFGTKRIYIGAMLAFLVGSALCAFAWDAPSLIFFRVLQGLGGGLITPVVMTILTKRAGLERRGRVLSIFAVPLLAGLAFGPVLGGWLVDAVSWRWVFLVNVPVGLLAVLLALLVLERDRPQPGHRLDWLGMALLSPGLTLLLFGFAETPEAGLGAASAWLPILTGATLVAAFLVHSWRTEVPLIDVRNFARAPARGAATILALTNTAVFGALLLVPLYFQAVRGASALDAGLLLIPQGVGAMLTMPLAGWITDHRGPGPLPALGIVLIAPGLLAYALAGESSPYPLLLAANFAIGAGMGLVFTPTITAAVQSLPPSGIARGSTAINVIDQATASIGTAAVSILLTVAASTRPGADAFGSAFAWMLALVLLAAVPALAMARRGPGRVAG